jgi:hypothetical protein
MPRISPAAARRDLPVLAARRRVSARVVVDQHHGGGGLAEGGREHFPGMDEACGERALGGEHRPDHPVPPVEQHDEEALVGRVAQQVRENAGARPPGCGSVAGRSRARHPLAELSGHASPPCLGDAGLARRSGGRRAGRAGRRGAAAAPGRRAPTLRFRCAAAARPARRPSASAEPARRSRGVGAQARRDGVSEHDDSTDRGGAGGSARARHCARRSAPPRGPARSRSPGDEARSVPPLAGLSIATKLRSRARKPTASAGWLIAASARWRSCQAGRRASECGRRRH